MRVVNKHFQACTVPIHRGTTFGNPFVIGKDGSREEVIKKYETYARTYLMEAIAALPESAILGCFCKPARCHGDTIILLWEELHGRRIQGPTKTDRPHQEERDHGGPHQALRREGLE